MLCKHRPASEALTSIVKGLLPTRRSIDKVRTRRAFVGATQPTIPSSGPVSCTSIVCSLKKREQRRPKRGACKPLFPPQASHSASCPLPPVDTAMERRGKYGQALIVSMLVLRAGANR